MHPQLQQLLDHEMLTPDEALELECYVTNDPQTFLSAPSDLLTKAQNSLLLLWFEPDALPSHRPH